MRVQNLPNASEKVNAALSPPPVAADLEKISVDVHSRVAKEEAEFGTGEALWTEYAGEGVDDADV